VLLRAVPILSDQTLTNETVPVYSDPHCTLCSHRTQHLLDNTSEAGRATSDREKRNVSVSRRRGAPLREDHGERGTDHGGTDARLASGGVGVGRANTFGEIASPPETTSCWRRPFSGQVLLRRHSGSDCWFQNTRSSCSANRLRSSMDEELSPSFQRIRQVFIGIPAKMVCYHTNALAASHFATASARSHLASRLLSRALELAFFAATCRRFGFQLTPAAVVRYCKP